MSIYPSDTQEIRNAIIVAATIQAAATIFAAAVAADRRLGTDDAADQAVNLAVAVAVKMKTEKQK